MDVMKLKYFLKICEESNISKAASGLFISQQGLSKSIISLENELKVPLFYRTPEGMVLTKYGEAIKDHAKTIVDEQTQIIQTIDRLKNPEYVHLQVYFSLGILNSLPVDFIQQFRFLNPNIKLQYIENSDQICRQAVLDHDHCVGIGVGPVDPSMFDSALLKSHKVQAIIHKDHPLAKKEYIDLEDLHQQNVITVNENFQMYHNFVNACKTKQVEANIVNTTGEIFVIYKLASLNKGIGLSVDFVSQDILLPDVKSIPLNCDLFTWDVIVFKKKNSDLNGPAATFVTFLKEYYGLLPA